MAAEYLKNFSYLFVPLTTDVIDQFPDFHKNIKEENGWECKPVTNRYLHRYVAEKVTGCQTEYEDRYHFRLLPSFAAQRELHLGIRWYSTSPKTYQQEQNVRFLFQIANVELFVFNTGICVLAFELRFRENDPAKIAAAQYYLRKISTEQICLADDAGCEESFSFVDISRKLLDLCACDIPLDFFFYATPKNEKANFLTYVDVPYQENYDKELYYLKWCYNDGFVYQEDAGSNDSENYVASASATWGITVSAAVCLVNRSGQGKEFIENVFQRNFRDQYLMTYILLLHQKYMMYLFLTKMSADLDGNLTELEKYKARLYDFETRYMFTYISEVPQYQRFYTKVRKLFSLEELFRGVQEPLSQLTEIKEKKQRERDERVNTSLSMLSVLTIVSAITDALGMTSGLEWLIPVMASRVIQLSAAIIVIIFCIVMLVRHRLLKKK